MEWHLGYVQSLAIIDREIGTHSFSPAEYEILRRVIYETADFEYKSLINFTKDSLAAGAAALAVRTTIVVDVPMVKVSLVPHLQKTFANPVYCSLETIAGPRKSKAQIAWGIKTLAQRYPEAIFVIGRAQTALAALVESIESSQMRPALVIATPSEFIEVNEAQQKLENAQIPYISISGRKGSAVIAVAIVNGLIDLAWQAYSGLNSSHP